MAMFIITGASGSGKTTLAKLLQERRTWKECISHTTRPMRDNEKDEETYYFISEDKFLEMSADGDFAEEVEYDGYRYGISIDEIDRVHDEHNHMFIILEYGGYKQIKKLYPEAIGIFIYMSKEDCMANMLLRGDTLSKSLSRILTYEDEIENRNEYDYVIKNVRGQVEATLLIIHHIVAQYTHFDKQPKIKHAQ